MTTAQFVAIEIVLAALFVQQCGLIAVCILRIRDRRRAALETQNKDVA